MNPKLLIPLLLLGALAGCVVVHDDPPPRRVVYSSPPPEPATTVVVTQDEEVHYVVYREYFGCTEEEIYVLPHYRRYYACTDDEIYFCFFMARCRGISFEVCWRSYYYDCHRSCDSLVVYYNVPRERFFVACGPGVSYPPGYVHAYGWYNGGRGSVTFSNTEYVALVHMKVGCEYQGHPPTTYFARVQSNNGNTGRVIVQGRDDCGHGGKTVTGVAIQKQAPRPWTMPPQQKQTWQQQHQNGVARSETQFKEVHREQVQKVQDQHPQPKTAPPATGRGPAADEHRTPAGKGDSGRPPQGSEPGSKGGSADHGPKGKGEAQAPPSKEPPSRGKGEEPSKGKSEEGPKGKGKGNDDEKGDKSDKGKKGDK